MVCAQWKALDLGLERVAFELGGDDVMSVVWFYESKFVLGACVCGMANWLSSVRLCYDLHSK